MLQPLDGLRDLMALTVRRRDLAHYWAHGESMEELEGKSEAETWAIGDKRWQLFVLS